MSASLIQLGPVAPAQPAEAVVAALGLTGDDAPAAGRPRVAAAMIASADGRATVAGTSAALGHPADTALLRELRTAVDAILVGTGTLRAERYANLLDDDQRARRVARGLEPEPIVATIARSGDVPVEIPLFSEPDARIRVYTETDVALGALGARVDVHRFPPGGADPRAVLAHLAAECGVRSVLCEGGPTLLRALVASACVDHYLVTVAPLLAAGPAPRILEADALDPPARLLLHRVHRADHHLLTHYVPAP